MRHHADDFPSDGAHIEPQRSPLLVALGERLRTLRSQRGVTRRALAAASQVSERHLSNLERGTGNASILILVEIAKSLDCSLAELLGDETTLSPEWLLIRELLGGRSEADLRKARMAVGELLGMVGHETARSRRVALIGLRGAGKSTLGRMLAETLDVEFVELGRTIESLAGCSVREIYNLYGAGAYRRYERRALEETIQLHSDVVMATPGGIVTDTATFSELLTHCTTVWLQAQPEEHMARVLAQGDVRPMLHNVEAMRDLNQILASRQPFYAKADLTLDTSRTSVSESLLALMQCLAVRPR